MCILGETHVNHSDYRRAVPASRRRRVLRISSCCSCFSEAAGFTDIAVGSHFLGTLGGAGRKPQQVLSILRAFTEQAVDLQRTFPVVCVGGSAGGLDAYTRLLRHLPADMGVAIVVVNHLRTVATLLAEILPAYTAMPVELITDGLVLKPNHVFVIPSQRDLHVLDGEFRLKPISKPRGWPDVITVFLRSLTAHWGGKLIAVIVSGYDGDGAAALCGIKDAGGTTIAQKPETAERPDMPGSAIASGCIDFVLSPEDIAQEIARIAYREKSKFYPTKKWAAFLDADSLAWATRET